MQLNAEEDNFISPRIVIVCPITDWKVWLCDVEQNPEQTVAPRFDDTSENSPLLRSIANSPKIGPEGNPPKICPSYNSISKLIKLPACPALVIVAVRNCVSCRSTGVPNASVDELTFTSSIQPATPDASAFGSNNPKGLVTLVLMVILAEPSVAAALTLALNAAIVSITERLFEPLVAGCSTLTLAKSRVWAFVEVEFTCTTPIAVTEYGSANADLWGNRASAAINSATGRM
jgi:hypothetical protein